MNLILVILDSLRKDCVSAYGPTIGREWFGTDVQTPSLAQFAESAMTLTKAFPESLPTLPFRRAIHTGRRAFPFKNYRPTKWDLVYLPGWQPIDEDVDTLAEALARAGYRTGYITDCLPTFQPSTNFHRGFHHWHFVRGQQQDRWQSPSCGEHIDLSRYFVSAKHEAGLKQAIAQYVANTAMRRSEEDWFAPQVFRLASRWLEENARQTPFFLLIDSFDPHEPWDPPQYYTDLYNPGYAGKNPIHPMYTAQPWCTESELTQMRANYCGEITMVDRWLGRFLEKIDDLGLRSNTAVAIISDHGHSLGDRGVSGKIPAYQHRELVELMLMMRHPKGSGAGQQSDNFVYNVDVVATLAAWAGVELTTQGRDLTPLVQGNSWEDRPFVTGALDNWVTYQDRTHKLIRRLDAADGATTAKLFDLRKDPQEQNNIAREEPALVEELFQRILRDAGGEIPHYQMPTTFADGSTWHRSFMPDS